MKKIYSFKFRTPFGPFCLTATPKGLYSCDVIASRAKGGPKQSGYRHSEACVARRRIRDPSAAMRPQDDISIDLAMTPKGKMPPRVHSLLEEAARKVSSYLRGQRVDFGRFPVDWTGLKTFERRVLAELRKIPWGRVENYQFLAGKAGRPKAARAVGRILHVNRLPFIAPCHRIVPKKGGVGGFSRGVRWKKRLLKIETSRADTRNQSISSGESEFDRVSGGVIISNEVSKNEKGVYVEAYCVKCRKKVNMQDPHEETLKNGRRAMKGKCPACGTNLCRILGSK